MKVHAFTTDAIAAPQRICARLHEESDAYPNLRLNPKWRVIECKGHLQWILQYQCGHREGRPTWRIRSFCTSRAGLPRCVGEHAGPVDSRVLDALRALPERIPKHA
jgi:hypothetical protein